MSDKDLSPVSVDFEEKKETQAKNSTVLLMIFAFLGVIVFMFFVFFLLPDLDTADKNKEERLKYLGYTEGLKQGYVYGKKTYSEKAFEEMEEPLLKIEELLSEQQRITKELNEEFIKIRSFLKKEPLKNVNSTLDNESFTLLYDFSKVLEKRFFKD